MGIPGRRCAYLTGERAPPLTRLARRLVASFGLAAAAYVSSCGGESDPAQPETQAYRTGAAVDTAGPLPVDSLAGNADSLAQASDSVVHAADSVSASEPLFARLHDEDAMSIDEMLADRIFQVSVASITDQSVSDPLLEALEALAEGRVGRAGPLIRKAQEAADALLDRRAGVAESSIAWSVIERYFEEAELL